MRAAIVLLLFSSTALADEPKKENNWWKSCTEHDETTNFTRIATGCSVFGLRIALTGQDIQRPTTFTVGAHAQGEEIGRMNALSIRRTSRMGIGGGGSGFDGELAGSLTVGARAPIAKSHGPFVRGGIAGQILGNDRFYASLLELPRAELGWQYMSGITVVEGGATAGLALDGRYGIRSAIPQPESPLVPLFGVAWGGYVTLQVPHLRMGVSAEAIPKGDQRSGLVVMGLAHACAVGFLLAACFDVRVMSEDGLAPFGDAKHATYYAGMTLGFSSGR